jgi:hypothetical protein
MKVHRLKLYKTYYNQGFFNVPVAYDRYVRPDEGSIELQVPCITRIKGHVNRSVNLNGTARIMGRTELRDWFQANFREQDEVVVEFVSPTVLRLGRGV